jgi:hypothetical protein
MTRVFLSSSAQQAPTHSAIDIVLAVVLTFLFVAVHTVVWLKVLERRSERKRGRGPDYHRR